MEQSKKWHQSKKLWVFLAATVAVVGGWACGDYSWSAALAKETPLALGYFGATGLQDGLELLGKWLASRSK